ncbi:MAG: hypothetical protein HY318_11415 [Armatimonadetes bacterium]|nr:hypothetical protein [Armatimonadota bacterium]
MDAETQDLISAGGKTTAHMKEQMPPEFKVKNKDLAAVEAKIDELQTSSDDLDASRAKTERLEGSHESLKNEVRALLVDYPAAVQGWSGKNSPQDESAPHLYHTPHSSTSTTTVAGAPTTPAGQGT